MTFAVVQVADRKTLADGAATTSRTMNWPTNLNPGDLVVGYFGGSANSSAITLPGGWVTMIPVAAGGGTNPYSSIGNGTYLQSYYIADGSETGTFTITSVSTRIAALVDRVTGWDTDGGAAGSPCIIAGTHGTGSNPAVASGAGTVPWGSADNLFCASIFNSNVPTGQSYPSGYTDNRATVTTDRLLRVAYANATNNTGPTTGAWGNSLDAWERRISVVKPGTFGGAAAYTQAVLVG